jgi:hypothetical protein
MITSRGWNCVKTDILFSFGARAPSVPGPPQLRQSQITHSEAQQSQGFLWTTSSLQRLLPDNTQHSQQTDIHAPGGIRTHNLSRRASADLLRLRPHSHWEWLQTYINICKIKTVTKVQKTELTLRSPLRKRRFSLDCIAI